MCENANDAVNVISRTYMHVCVCVSFPENVSLNESEWDDFAASSVPSLWRVFHFTNTN